MAYTITSRDQIMDIESIRSKLLQLKAELVGFDTYGQEVIDAGQTCSANALSVSGASYEQSLIQTGQEIKNIKPTYEAIIDQTINNAQNVYNAQVNMYNEYLAYLERQRQEQQQLREQQERSAQNARNGSTN